MLNNIESTGMLMRAKAISSSAHAMKGIGMDQQHKWRCMRGWTEPARHDGYAEYAMFSMESDRGNACTDELECRRSVSDRKKAVTGRDELSLRALFSARW